MATTADAKSVISAFDRAVIGLTGGIGADPSDSDELRLQKSLLVASTMMMASLAVIWGLVYIAFDEMLAGAIPLGYAVASFFSVAIFAGFRRFRLLRTSQLALSLLLPFLLMTSLGGFVNSSVVVLRSVTSPLGALLFAGYRHALGWFAAYVALVLAGLLLEPFGRDANNLPQAVILTFFVMNIIGVSVVMFLLTRYFIIRNELVAQLLTAEKARSEAVLDNVMPRHVVARLQAGEYPIAEAHAEATILFADLVGFSALTARLAPYHLVELLDELFSAFDDLARRHGLEKLKTIGDAYMAMALPGLQRNGRDAANAAARMACAMQSVVADLAVRHRLELTLRIGLHCGSVVAGVIGHTRQHYDVWGQAVNVANRLDAVGVPGRIQVSETAFLRLRDDFTFEERGSIDLKDGTSLRSYLLCGEVGGA